jgi:uncharacterized protein YndB with AHSA1/START domain
MKWLIRIAGILAVLALAVYGIGSGLPREDSFTRTRVIGQPPEDVWKVIRDYAGQPLWHSGLRSAYRLPDENGREIWKVTDSHGESMNMEILQSDAPRLLVNHFAGGRAKVDLVWTLHLSRVAGGSGVALTQTDNVPNPFLRFMVRLFFGTKFVSDYLNDLGKKFGEPPTAQ